MQIKLKQEPEWKQVLWQILIVVETHSASRLKVLLQLPDKDRPSARKINTNDVTTGSTARDSSAIRLCPTKNITRG